MSDTTKRILLPAVLILLVFCGAAVYAAELGPTQREAWLEENKGKPQLKKALERLKKADVQHPTVKDAAMAARCADIDFLKKIKENGFSKWDAPEIMIAACKTPFPDIVRTIHQWGGDVKAKDKDGWTALMAAALTANNLETVKYLVSQGADIHAKDNVIGWTTLRAAAGRADNLETVKYLVSQGADIHVKDKQGITALMAAVDTTNNLETVKYLVSEGADIHAKDKNGRTVLMYAAKVARKNADNLETVKYLVSQGADVNTKTGNGKTALDMARRKNVKEYLLSVGAKSGKELE